MMSLWSVLLALLVLIPSGVRPVQAQAPPPAFKVLVFTKVSATGYTHDSIPFGVAAVQSLGARNNFAVDATNDAAAFSDANLTQYNAVIWLNTNGEVLDDSQRAVFERYIQAGNGYVGIHSAGDTEQNWPWYLGLVGTSFGGHPPIQSALVRITDRSHPSTLALPETWSRIDEWNDWVPNPRSGVHVLATVDETTYQGGKMGDDHPIAWFHTYQNGRAWYTGGGHTVESYGEPLFLRHLLGGIQYAAGAKVSLYRLSHPNGWHLLTASQDEHDFLLTAGWTSRGPAGYVALSPANSGAPDRAPLFRLYSPFSGDHFYTTDAFERDQVVQSGYYTDEGVAGYVFTADAPGRKPLYRAYNPDTGQHVFTDDAAEYDALGGQWSREGIAAYVSAE